MVERRKLKRRHILFYSRIFDRKTGKLLGYLGNITTEGVMVISEESIRTNESYKLRMDLPEYIYQKPVLNFRGCSLWCETDVDPNFYNIGFRFTNITQEDQDIITNFVIDYGFRD
jgi:hypothetical protein